MKAHPRVKYNFTFELTLSEEEARALNALTSYGAESFLSFFYKSLGKTFLEKHEDGLRELFSNIDTVLNPLLESAKKLHIRIEEGFMLKNKKEQRQ